MRWKLVILALFITLVARGQQERYSCIPFAEDPAFTPGEVLNFGVSYKWGAVNTEVAQAKLVLEETTLGRERVLHSDVTARTAPFFDVFFKMRENFQTWFTLDDHRPLAAVRDTYENGYTATNNYKYDWEAGFIRADVAFNGEPSKHYDMPLQGKSNDIVSLIYALRSVDWNTCKIGEPIVVPFAIDDAIFQVKVTYQGQEDLKVRRIGKCRALRFSCSVVAGALFAGDQELQVWFSDDGNHLPLAVMAPLKVGNMWAWLKSWDGLKSPFEARY